MQSVANSTGSTSIQTEINRVGAKELRSYFDLYRHNQLGPVDEALPKLLDSLDHLVEVEGRLKSKNVNLLLESCYIARMLNGARTVSCKSAKDRSSMFQTLEVTCVALRNGWIDE
jgi:inositol polyphosphate-4-phosphatase